MFLLRFSVSRFCTLSIDLSLDLSLSLARSMLSSCVTFFVFCGASFYVYRAVRKSKPVANAINRIETFQ